MKYFYDSYSTIFEENEQDHELNRPIAKVCSISGGDTADEQGRRDAELIEKALNYYLEFGGKEGN